MQNTFPEQELLAWYKKEKRPLPWRNTHDPYHIWVSEIMLQQTQVSRVIDYYQRFLERFPNIFVLSRTSWDEFLPFWKGLGFYSRGKNMLKTAQIIANEYKGVFPLEQEKLQKLPGIGEYTSSAVLSFAHNIALPALDTNLLRVLGRLWGNKNKFPPDKGDKGGFDKYKKQIKKLAHELYPKLSAPDLVNHALMDIGASICGSKKTLCENCPIKKECNFFASGNALLLNTEKKTPKIPEPKIDKHFSLAAIYKDKKYLFVKKEDKWGFPSFLREKSKDHRHLLQEKLSEKYGIQASVRPPFATEILEEGEEYWKIACSRTQILQGEISEKEHLLWLAPSEFETMNIEEGIFPFLEMLKKMRFPKD
jgi:A/G-specific adenine glycosylase